MIDIDAAISRCREVIADARHYHLDTYQLAVEILEHLTGESRKENQ